MTEPTAPEADRDLVVTLLRRSGPNTLAWVRGQPDLRDWSKERIEQAVVRAWSEDRLTVDVEDRFVVL